MQNKEKLKTQTSKVECIESGKITTLIQSFFHLTETPTSHRSSVEKLFSKSPRTNSEYWKFLFSFLRN